MKKTIILALGLATVITVPVIMWKDHTTDRRVGSEALDARLKAYAQAKAENDSLQIRYDGIIDNLLDSIESLNNQIQQSELLLTQIKNKRNEKITRINKLTTDELSRAITNNYKERIAD